MNDDDLIRRGEVLERLSLAEHDAEERDWRSGANEIARLRRYVEALPAVTLPDVAKVVEEAGEAAGDETYDTMMEVQRNPAGAFHAIQSQADTIRALITLATAQAAEIAGLEQERDRVGLEEKMRMVAWCSQRQAVTAKAWQRAARKALAGDMSELRNRIDMIDAGPLDIVLSGDTRAEAAETALAAERAKVARLVEALRPFDACVFNDNGDITISNGDLKRRDWLALRAALSEAEART